MCTNAGRCIQTEIIEENGCDRPRTRAVHGNRRCGLCTVSPNAVSLEENEANHILGASVQLESNYEVIPSIGRRRNGGRRGWLQDDSYVKALKLKLLNFNMRSVGEGLSNADSQSMMQIGSVVPSKKNSSTHKGSAIQGAGQNMSMESEYCVYNDSCNVSTFPTHLPCRKHQITLTESSWKCVPSPQSNVPPASIQCDPTSCARASLRTSGCIPEVIEDEEHDGTTEPGTTRQMMKIRNGSASKSTAAFRRMLKFSPKQGCLGSHQCKRWRVRTLTRTASL